MFSPRRATFCFVSRFAIAPMSFGSHVGVGEGHDARDLLAVYEWEL